MAYVSEVSHLHNGRAYVLAGGLYVDPVLGENPTSALIVPSTAGPNTQTPLPVEMPAADAIDYYARIPLPEGSQVSVGDTVIFGFRAQVFVTRALTAAISGVSTGTPIVKGVWASDGSAPLTPNFATRH